MFGQENIKNLTLEFAPAALPIFCQRFDQGFTGDDIGLSEKVCDDFHLSPTDNGMCLTKNMDINKIVKDTEHYQTLFEPDLQTNQKILSGTTWGQISIVFWLPDDYLYEESFMQRSEANKKTMKFQLHPSTELASIFHGDTFDFSTIAETLEANHEYFYKVTPFGFMASEGMKSLDIHQRNCHTKDELSSSSIFKIYRKKNCEYECRVNFAILKCKCAPWDFIYNHNAREIRECDIFGRTCFYDTIGNITLSNSFNNCDHCIDDCDRIEFKKELIKAKVLSKVDEYGDMKGEYLKSPIYWTECVGEKAFAEFFCDFNMTFWDRQTLNLYNSLYTEKKYSFERSLLYKNAIIIHLNFVEPEITLLAIKYSLLDKLANFGGKFGIFAQLTGCSLLAILNILLVACKCFFSQRKQTSNH